MKLKLTSIIFFSRISVKRLAGDWNECHFNINFDSIQNGIVLEKTEKRSIPITL